MNKKIIAVLLLATVLFMSIFAGCKKEEEEGVYVKNDDIPFVTDENGEKVLDYDGRVIVYATDEDGKKIKDENGEYVTVAQEFQPIEDDGVVEDLGFKFTIPEGWKTTNKFGEFVNEETSQNVLISIVHQTYDDYYNSNKEFYDEAKKLYGDKVEWQEDIDLGEDFEGVCRFVTKTDEGTAVMYFFVNSTNLYKILFNSPNTEDAIADSEEFLKGLSFKPFAYYDDITSKSTTAAATEAASTTAAE